MKTIGVKLKSDGDLNIQLDSDTLKMVATKAQLTYQLESSKALAAVDGVTEQWMITDLQLAATQLKNERYQAVEKLSRVRMLFFCFFCFSYIYALTFFIFSS